MPPELVNWSKVFALVLEVSTGGVVGGPIACDVNGNAADAASASAINDVVLKSLRVFLATP